MSANSPTEDREGRAEARGLMPKGQRFDLLRYFSWATFIVLAFVFVASGCLVVYVVHNVHVEIEQDEADSLAETVVSTLKPLGLDQSKWPQDAAAEQAQRDLQSTLSNFNILELDLFTADGDALACVGLGAGPARDAEGRITQQHRLWRPGFSAARAGSVKTRWEAENWWRYFFPSSDKTDVVATYVPVKEEGKVVAIAVVRRDLAKTLTQTHAELPRLMLLAAAVALGVFLCLRLIIRRAGRIMREQRGMIEEINNELELRNKYLEAYDKRKDEFLSICSHDVRSPLMSILAGCQVLLKGKKGPLNEIQREILEHSVANAHAVVKLTEALLDLARIEAGQEALNLECFDPVQVIKESLQAHQAAAESRGVTFDLQAPAAPVTLKADRLKVLRVCNNLVSNAAKHSRAGVVRVRAETGDGPAPSTGSRVLRIAVTDCGKGIRPEDMTRLFDRFSALARHKSSRAEGTGLGLSITRALIELHGGRIDVTSEEGKGATFTVTLPLAGPERLTADVPRTPRLLS